MNIKKNENKTLSRKPSLKKPPEVRQTLASKYRLLKANPLLMHEVQKKLVTSNGEKEVFSIVPLKTLAKAFDGNPSLEPLLSSSSKVKTMNQHKPKPRSIKIQAYSNKSNPNKFNPSNVTKTDFASTLLSSTIINDNKTKIKMTSIRRSRSAEKFDKQNIAGEFSMANTSRSQSSERIIAKPIIKEEKSWRAPSQISQKNCFTPISARKSMFLSTPGTQEVSQRLNEWLRHKGRSIQDFHHLKCFGIHGKKSLDASSNKENSNFSNIVANKDIDECEINHLENLARDALKDLHRLILDGFSGDQCEKWLKLIRQKYKKLEEEPQYWECRAALEQTRGNIVLAVECFKSAIVHGAEIAKVDKSLDQLLQKFSVLNINKEDKEGNKAKTVKDPWNIFKSSVIQFAVEERTLKQRNSQGVTVEKKLIATPVRRSTRLTRSTYTSTPGVKLYSTLQEIDSPVRSTLGFKNNVALLD